MEVPRSTKPAFIKPPHFYLKPLCPFPSISRSLSLFNGSRRREISLKYESIHPISFSCSLHQICKSFLGRSPIQCWWSRSVLRQQGRPLEQSQVRSLSRSTSLWISLNSSSFLLSFRGLGLSSLVRWFWTIYEKLGFWLSLLFQRLFRSQWGFVDTLMILAELSTFRSWSIDECRNECWNFFFEYLILIVSNHSWSYCVRFLGRRCFVQFEYALYEIWRNLTFCSVFDYAFSKRERCGR